MSEKPNPETTNVGEIDKLKRALFEAVGLLEFTSALGKQSPVVQRGRELLCGWEPAND